MLTEFTIGLMIGENPDLERAFWDGNIWPLGFRGIGSNVELQNGVLAGAELADLSRDILCD